MKGRDYFKYLLYASLLFLGWKLYKDGILDFSVVASPFSFLIASALAITSFLWAAALWKLTLGIYAVRIDYKSAIITTGLPIFAKYIPGSIWSVVGSAEHVTRDFKISRKITFLASFEGQMMSLLTGFILSLFCVFLVDWKDGLKWVFPLLVLIVACVLILFSGGFRQLVSRIIFKVFRKQFEFPEAPAQMILRQIPGYALTWCISSVSFYVITLGVSPNPVPYSVLWVFPMAGVFGIVAIFSPGGLGVREGIATALLVAIGFDTRYAATISVVSRGVFLIAEFSIFIFALALNYFNKEQKV